MKKKLVMLLLLLLLIVGCSHKEVNKEAVSNIYKSDIKIEHKYSRNTFESKITPTKKLLNSNLDIKLTMTNGIDSIFDVKLRKVNNSYTTKVEIPKEGIWSIKYHIKYKNKTILRSYKEILRTIGTELENNKIEKIEILTNPTPVVSNKETTYRIRLLNKQNENISNAQVIFQIEKGDFNFTSPMDIKLDHYELKTLLKEKGEYNLKLHIFIENKHTMEELKIVIDK